MQFFECESCIMAHNMVFLHGCPMCYWEKNVYSAVLTGMYLFNKVEELLLFLKVQRQSPYCVCPDMSSLDLKRRNLSYCSFIFLRQILSLHTDLKNLMPLFSFLILLLNVYCLADIFFSYSLRPGLSLNVV